MKRMIGSLGAFLMSTHVPTCSPPPAFLFQVDLRIPVREDVDPPDIDNGDMLMMLYTYDYDP